MKLKQMLACMEKKIQHARIEIKLYHSDLESIASGKRVFLICELIVTVSFHSMILVCV